LEELEIGLETKILLVTTYKYPGGGGLSTYMEQVKLGLTSQDHKVSSLSFNTLPNIFNKFLRFIFAFKNIMFPFFFRLFLLFQKLFYRITLFFMNLKEKWNIIHAQDPLAVIYSSFLKKKYKLPLIFTMHGFFVQETLLYFNKQAKSSIYNFLTSLEKDAIALSSSIIAVEKSRFEYISKNRVEMIHLMENFVHTGLFKNKKLTKNYFTEVSPQNIDVFKLVTPKRLTKQANIQFLNELALILKRRDKRIHFFVLGEGPEENNIKMFILKNKLENVITILKPIPHEKMPFIYNSANAVILPSKEEKGVIEGSSYAVLEAMACEKPVLLSNIPPFQSLITPGENGMTFDLKNPEDVISKILKLKDDPKFSARLGENSRKLVIKNHSLKSNITSLLKIYGISK